MMRSKGGDDLLRSSFLALSLLHMLEDAGCKLSIEEDYRLWNNQE